MLVKTLILGLISAGAAGAVVYYGTAPLGSQALETHPHDGVSAEKTIKSEGKPAIKSERARIKPRLPTIRKAEENDGRQKLASSGWEKEANRSEAMPPAEGDETSDAPKKETRWLDQYLKNNTQYGDAPKAKDLKVEIYETAEGSSASAVNSYTAAEPANTDNSDLEEIEAEPADEDLPGVKAPAAKNQVTDPRTFRIEDGKLVEVDAAKERADTADVKSMADTEAKRNEHADHPEMAKTQKHSAEKHPTDKSKAAPFKFAHDANDMANDSTPLLSTVMREASVIKKAELRDQAYFEITEYALSEGRFDSARMAHDMIEQDELSYTAKSRIAVAYAQNGQPTKAFKVISEVDEAELRDFMRLQVIEALIAPQRLPQAWQEKAN